jgi:hypothetical protein
VDGELDRDWMREREARRERDALRDSVGLLRDPNRLGYGGRPLGVSPIAYGGGTAAILLMVCAGGRPLVYVLAAIVLLLTLGLLYRKGPRPPD